MRLWPWSRPEVRSSSYADKIVSQLLSSASGASAEGGALGALETAARIWGAGLSSATVKPDNVALKGHTAVVLDSIGRAALPRR